MLKSLFLIAIAAIAIKCQSEGDLNLDVVDEETPEQKAAKAAELKEKKEMDTLYYACVILSRYQLSFYGNQLLDIVKNQPSFQDQNDVWKKLYAGHVLKCSEKMDYDRSVKALSELKINKFDFKEYVTLFQGFDFDIFKTAHWPREFSDMENDIWRLIEEFESALAEKREENKQQPEKPAEIDDLEYLKSAAGSYKMEPEPLRSQGSKSSEIVFLILAFGLIGFFLYLGYLKLSKEEEDPKLKKRKVKEN